MLQNAYFLAKIGADTAENEQHFAEILPTDALWAQSQAPTDSSAGQRTTWVDGTDARSLGQLAGDLAVSPLSIEF